MARTAGLGDQICVCVIEKVERIALAGGPPAAVRGSEKSEGGPPSIARCATEARRNSRSLWREHPSMAEIKNIGKRRASQPTAKERHLNRENVENLERKRYNEN